MAITIPYINPVRFRPYANLGGSLISNDMPRIDKMENQTQYYNGVYPIADSTYKADWKLNEEIVIQMRVVIPSAAPNRVMLTTPSGIVNIPGTLLTDDRWKGDPVYNYSYTPTEIGDYYFTTLYSDGVSWISDVFYVHPNEMNLVEVQYYDSENRYSGFFWTTDPIYHSPTSVWKPKAYFTGIQDIGEPQNEISSYIDDSGEPKKTQAEPQDTILLQFTDITKNHVKQLNGIFSCDTLFVNGQPVENIENIKIEDIPKNNGMNASINLVQSDNDGFVKNY